MSSQPVQKRGTAIYEFGLPDRLRVARESAGYDQRQFAAVTGISRGSIGNYENASTTPRRPVILAWATATGMDVHWLETGEVPADDEDLEVRRQGLEPRTRYMRDTASQNVIHLGFDPETTHSGFESFRDAQVVAFPAWRTMPGVTKAAVR